MFYENLREFFHIRHFLWCARSIKIHEYIVAKYAWCSDKKAMTFYILPSEIDFHLIRIWVGNEMLIKVTRFFWTWNWKKNKIGLRRRKICACVKKASHVVHISHSSSAHPWFMSIWECQLRNGWASNSLKEGRNLIRHISVFCV